MLALLNIGPLEWIVLLGGAVLLFGGDLPGVIRKLAQLLGRLRAMASDLSREVDLHGRYEAPPETPPARLPPPPVDFADAEFDEHADEHAEPGTGTDDAAARAPRAGEHETSEPADHSDWEPESGADQPRRLDNDDA